MTQDVPNQPPPLTGSNAWRGDPLLIQIAENFSEPVRRDLNGLGRFVLTQEAQDLARLANSEVPKLRTHDRQGRAQGVRHHRDDARALGLVPGARVRCRTERSSLEVCVEEDDSVRRGVVTLPHGYGQRYGGESPIGPAVNRLTSTSHCDPLSKTPWHKYVPVHIEPLQAPLL